MLCTKAVLKVCKIHREIFEMETFLNNVAGVDNSTSKKASSQVFSCKFQENFLRSFLTE